MAGHPARNGADGAVKPLPREWVRSWISALHGFEAQHVRLEAALVRAVDHLTAGDEESAKEALDLGRIERLSPEGAVLADAVAAELDISPLGMAVGIRSLPWGGLDHVAQLALFRRFGGAAHQFEKAGNPDQPRWPKDAPDSQGGEYARTNAAVGSAEPDARLGVGGNGGPPIDGSPETLGIGHNGGPPLDDLPDIPEEEPPTAQLRNAVIRNIAVWALKRGLVALIPGVGEAAAIVQLGVWVYQYLPYIDAYIQSPQTLEDLQNAANDPSTRLRNPPHRRADTRRKRRLFKGSDRSAGESCPHLNIASLADFWLV